MIILDERGKNCPIPVIDTKSAIEQAEKGDRLEIIVDNEIAVQNVKKLIVHFGFSVEFQKLSEKEFHLVTEVLSSKEERAAEKAKSFQKQGFGADENASSETAAAGSAYLDSDASDAGIGCEPDIRKKGEVIAIGSDQMGEPHEELGRLLMNGFILAVLKQDVLPETMIFYNGGASLTCEGSKALSDIKELESLGVDIVTCGTCLKTLGIEEQLRVGRVSNMYEIVELMTNAKTLIRP